MSIITDNVLMEINQEAKVSSDKDQLQQESKIASQQSIAKIGAFIMNKNDLLGSGSFSRVYRGHDVSNQKMQVAIKVIEKQKLNQDLKRLIESQIKILRLINHPNIVKCYEILQDQVSIYIVMQLCEDGDLESRIDKHGALEESQALGIIKEVFRGLLYLCQMNIIHRDIKVANIFIHKNTAKIADFGFAMHNKTKKQFQDISIGSPIYMSPQGIKHNVYGPKTDIWAFGIFIFELLHGKTPYSHCTKEKQLKYNISTPLNWSSFKAALSYSIKDLMLKCLEVNYEKRITFEKLKDNELLKDQFQQIKHSQKGRTKHSSNLSDFYLAKTQRQKKLQTALMTPNFSTIESPQARQAFKDYCQKLQKELSINLSIKQCQKTFMNKIKDKPKGQFDERNHRDTHFLRLLSPHDKKTRKSKSRETPRTRAEVLSLQKQRNINMAEIQSYSNHIISSTRAVCLNPIYRLKSQPIQSDILHKYKQYYAVDTGGKSPKKLPMNSYHEKNQELLPTFGAINSHKVTKSNHNGDHHFSFVNQFHCDRQENKQSNLNNYQSFKYGQRHNENIRQRVNSPNLRMKSPKNQVNRIDISHKTDVDGFFRKPKEKEQFHSLRQNKIRATKRVNYEKQNKVSEDYYQFYSGRNIRVRKVSNQMGQFSLDLTFPDSNIDCHMYLIHFSRLLYKLSCSLRIKAYLWQIRNILSNLCLSILYQVIKKIESVHRQSIKSVTNPQTNPLNLNLSQIQETAQKYLTQYKQQFQTTNTLQIPNINLMNSKLQRQLNFMLQKQIKSNKSPQCDQSARLMYLGWVYLVHYKQVLSQRFMNDQIDQYWFEYNCRNVVKYIEQDIETVITVQKVQTYLKLKLIIEQRHYS